MFKKSAKEIENSSAHYQTKKIVCSTDYKTFFTNLNSAYFALKFAKEIESKRIIRSTDCKTKKIAKKFKIVQLITKRKRLSAQQIAKRF